MRHMFGVMTATCLVILASAPGLTGGSTARATEVFQRDILVDPVTGIAMRGYDPVAYFVDRTPRLGLERFEMEWGGVVWRFVNEGNMDAFADAPEVYAPAYGGHDPLAFLLGSFTHGDPKIWLIQEQRLLFFFSKAKRFLWLASASRNLEQTDRLWQERMRKERTSIPEFLTPARPQPQEGEAAGEPGLPDPAGPAAEGAMDPGQSPPQ